MIVKLMTELHLEFLSLTEGCGCSSESTLGKMPHCWKSHAMAHIYMCVLNMCPCEITIAQPAVVHYHHCVRPSVRPRSVSENARNS